MVEKEVISYYYKKRDVEYLKGCKKRGVEPNKNRLFNDKLICDMVQQLDKKELESHEEHIIIEKHGNIMLMSRLLIKEMGGIIR